MSKHTPQVQLVPLTSAFDFREGAFAAGQRTRKALMVAGGAGLAALTAVAGAGALAVLSIKTSETAQLEAQSQQVTAAAQLAKIDNAGGNSAEQLAAHIRVRSAAQAAAVGAEVDVVKLIAGIRASAAGEVKVTQVVFKSAAAPAPTPAPAAPVPGAPAAPAATGTVPAAPAAVAAPATVEVHATATSFSAIGPWSQRLGQVPGIAAVQPMWSNGEPALQLTMTATLNEQALTGRAADLTKTKGAR